MTDPLTIVQRFDRGGGSFEDRPIVIQDTRTISATATLTLNDATVLCDATAGAIIANLPTAASFKNRIYTVKKTDATANTVTIDPSGAETIDGAATLVISTQNDQVTFQSDGTAWRVLSRGAATPSAGSLDTFSAYDNTGGQSFTTTAITVNLDVVKKNSDATNFSIAADEVTIQEAGYYLFTLQVTAQETTGNNRSFRAWLEEGGVEVDGTQAFAGGKMGEDEKGTASMSIAMDVTAAQVFRMRAVRDGNAGTFITVIDASRLTIVKLGT